jgi:hypothetical protein
MVDEDNLFYRLQEILTRICRQELDEVFGTWINWSIIVNGATKPIYHKESITPRAIHILTMTFGWRKDLPTIR